MPVQVNNVTTLKRSDKVTKVNTTRVTSEAGLINKMIVGIRTRSNSLKRDVAICAASCVLHAIQHGNVTLASDLCSAMGDGWRLNALRDWFTAMGPFAWSKEEKTFTLDKPRLPEFKKEMDSNKAAFASRLVDEPYWVFKPEKEYEGFNLPALLSALLAKAEKKASNDKYKNDPKTVLTGLDRFRKLALEIDTSTSEAAPKAKQKKAPKKIQASFATPVAAA